MIFGGFSPNQSTPMRMDVLCVFLLPFTVTTLIATRIGIVWVQRIADPH